MKRLTLALLLALVASAVVAQPARNISSSTHPVTANVALAYDGTTGHLAKQAIAVLPKIVNVAQLPTCSASYFGAIATVTDGNGATDCTTGLSTTDVACECNGSAWVARYTGTADLSGYVLKTAAAQQSVTASGAGNDVSLVAADDVILTPADDLTVTAANDANLSTTAGNIGITAGGTTQDITLTAVDDVIFAATDDTTVGGADFLVNTTTIALDAAANADEVTVTANKVEIGAGVEFRIIGASAPPAACAAGTKGSLYFDTDIAKMCVCNGTNYVLMNDDSTTTGCS